MFLIFSGWNYNGSTTGIMDEFYKKFEEYKNADLTDEEKEEKENELFEFLQDKFKEIQSKVQADVNKLVEKDAKMAEELKELNTELENRFIN